MKKLFLLLIILLTTASAQQIKLIKRTMTDAEFIKFKKSVGTYDQDKNYNKIINGHGSGLKPPTEEQWEKMKNQPILIDRIESGTTVLPSSCDNSTTIWFPPIGNQGSKNSCVSWACGYYTKTFQEAREHNWDLSGCIWESGQPTLSYQNKIFSPDFIYHQVNNGGNNSTFYADNINLLECIGCCTWDKMPCNPYSYITWPTESAWRQAPLYRSQTGYGYTWVDTDTNIEYLKQLLVNGNLAIIAVDDDYFYSHLTSEDLWTLDNYPPSGTNHANTIVGYDDNFGPYAESGNSNTYGAFKVANSWGVGGWEHIADGFYYISYECMKHRIQLIYLYQNYIDYKPKMVAVFNINHNYRGENQIDFGIGDPSSLDFHKSLNNFYVKGGNFPYPNNPIVVDITEFIPYMSGSACQFFMQVYDGGTSTIEIIESFSVEMYDDYASGVPTKTYISAETPVSTIQNNTVYANIIVPLPVELTSFNASIKNTDVVLNWETATEINNYGFEIEKRVDNSVSEQNDLHWQKIGFVRGHGNSNSPKVYNFTDKNLIGGTKFNYRLKQIDINGNFEYSNSIEADITPKEYELSQNYL